jgi:hypothetical protein
MGPVDVAGKRIDVPLDRGPYLEAVKPVGKVAGGGE